MKRGHGNVPMKGSFLPRICRSDPEAREPLAHHGPALLTIPKKPGLSSGTCSSGYTVSRNHLKSLHWSLVRSCLLSVTSPKGSWGNNKTVSPCRSQCFCHSPSHWCSLINNQPAFTEHLLCARPCAGHRIKTASLLVPASSRRDCGTDNSNPRCSCYREVPPGAWG